MESRRIQYQNKAVKPAYKKLKFNSVLIIDDDEMDLMITERLLLNKANVKKVYKETNPLNALDFIKSVKNKKDLPEIILLDLRMPGFDGFAFLEELAACPLHITSACRVLILSAYFQLEPELIDLTRKYSFVYQHLAKPLDIYQIEST